MEPKEISMSGLALQLGNRIRESFPNVTERYYKPRFLLDASGNKGEDQCTLFHSNRIALVTLAPSHPILREGKTVTKVNFQVNEKLNRLSNLVSGKRKRGGQKLQKESAMCIVSCSDGKDYTLVSTVPGTLMEVNDRLSTSPHLLTLKPWSSGYIAIVLPPMKMDVVLLETMTSPEDYLKQRRDSIPSHFLSASKTCEVPAIVDDA